MFHHVFQKHQKHWSLLGVMLLLILRKFRPLNIANLHSLVFGNRFKNHKESKCFISLLHMQIISVYIPLGIFLYAKESYGVGV